MKKFNRTKIIATIGPASSSREELERLMLAGMSMARINFSHGSYDDHAEVIRTVRDLNRHHGLHVGILADLQGPKIRLGGIAGGGVMIAKGDELVITSTECEGSAQRVHITYPGFASDVAAGERILVNDGKLVLRVKATDGRENVTAVVEHGGKLEPRKGVNLPNTAISLPSLTEKDLKDLDFLLSMEVEWVGLSFVRKSSDVMELKRLIADAGKRTKVVAKIEKPEAISELSQIIRVADGVMVARGDLGVELPMEQVPVIQKTIVRKCMAAGRPVIIATQMMESMIENPSPTRAEVNDVANSVMDGADAVMLSGETSVGAHPHKVVEAMSTIVGHIEAFADIYYRTLITSSQPHRMISDAICHSAVLLAKETNSVGIITMTNSGYTAYRISSYRPKAGIFVFTDNRTLLSTLSMVWGVRGYYYDRYESTDQTIADIKAILRDKGVVSEGELIINIASMPITDKGQSNMVKLSLVE